MATKIRYYGLRRRSLMRERTHEQRCYYCYADGARWRYGTRRDGATRIEWAPQAFCNITCWDASQF